jgi:hypothetical protein
MAGILSRTGGMAALASRGGSTAAAGPPAAESGHFWRLGGRKLC